MPTRSFVAGWIDLALRYEEENRELRRLMTDLLLAIAENRHLLEYARSEIEVRWPTGKGGEVDRLAA